MSQLTNYIQKELGKGFSKELITKKLLQAGYTQQEIAESLKSLKSAEPLLRRKLIDTIHEDAKVVRSKWLFSLIGIILLIGFVYLILQYVSIPAGTVCDNIADVQEKDICYLELAANGEDVCGKISASSVQLACTEKLWETQQCVYEKIIGKISDICKEPEEGCELAENYGQCITDLALKEQNVEICQKRLNCVTAFAIQMNDGSLCQTLTRGQKYCTTKYYEETGDAQYCTAGNLACGYNSEATEQEKIEFFEQNIAAMDEEGFNDYVLEFAIENNEPLACQYLQETDVKIQEILDANSITMSDFCIIAIAHNTKNSTICEMLIVTHKYSLCIESLNCTEGELCNEME